MKKKKSQNILWGASRILLGLALLLLGGIGSAAAEPERTPAVVGLAGHSYPAPGRDDPVPAPSITIAKLADVADGALFYFTGDLEPYMIASGSVTYGGLATGDYTITETVPDGWLLSDVSCGGVSGSVTYVTDGVTIHLGADDAVTCTWTNTKIVDAIRIEKAVKSAATLEQFYFSGSLGLFDLLPGEEGTFFSLAAGDYTVAEIVPDGWFLKNIICEGGDATLTATGAVIHLDENEYITCTFTNQRANLIYLPLVSK